jgi:hypothetical protein
MDTTSIVRSHPASADGEARWQGALAAQAPVRGSAMKAASSAPAIMKQPNPLDSAAQSYQGGAFVTLDFTPEVERPKAARSICPTTT